jgi:hypothetical protein
VEFQFALHQLDIFTAARRCRVAGAGLREFIGLVFAADTHGSGSSGNWLQYFNGSHPELFRSGRIYEVMETILQVEKLVQRHIEKAVEITQHLLSSLPQRHSLGC